MGLKAAIFDYKTVLVKDQTLAIQIRGLLEWLRSTGIKICVFTTQPTDIASKAQALGYPAIDVTINGGDIAGRKNRGSPAWIDTATERLGVSRKDLIYIGATVLDWRTAVNSGVVYMHAAWSGANNQTCLVAETPADVRIMSEHFLLQAPRWSYSWDDSNRRFSLRALLPASATLPSTSPSASFKLQDIFTYNMKVRVGGENARDLLALHVLTSCHAEGLLAQNSFFCIYPGSRPGKISGQLAEYVKPSASLVHGYYRDDLLLRDVPATDTSLERVAAKRQGRQANVSIKTQTSTVRLNAKYRSQLEGRSVIVFDDFTTTGMSLEWARNLFLAAGVDHVVLLAIGKYGGRYQTYDLKCDSRIDAFGLNDLDVTNFNTRSHQLTEDLSTPPRLSKLFEQWVTTYQ
ncbi:hypothetical protein ACWDWO_21575 [Actinopolymorpha singaporensis]